MALQTRSGAEGRRRDLNQEEACKDVLQYPRPSRWVMRHVVDLNHFLVWQPSQLPSVFLFALQSPFWRSFILHSSGWEGTLSSWILMNTLMLKRLALLSPRPCSLLTEGGAPWVRLSQGNVCAQNSESQGCKEAGMTGVTLLTDV